MLQFKYDPVGMNIVAVLDFFNADFGKASVTIMADFSPEFNPPVRWRSKHQTKNDC